MKAVQTMLARRATTLGRVDIRAGASQAVRSNAGPKNAQGRAGEFNRLHLSPLRPCIDKTAPSRLAVRAYAVQANVVEPSSLTHDGSEPTWRIRMLYDGDCPLCMREVNFLRGRDGGAGVIDFVDIAAPEYTAERNAGLTFEQAMGEIHVILPDGSVVTKVEVFRRLYEAVGLGWVYAVTTVPAIGRAADAVYDVWAKYRLPITGRPGLLEVMRTRDEAGCRPAREAAATGTAGAAGTADSESK